MVSRIVAGRSSVTAETALKVAASFRTTLEFWLLTPELRTVFLVHKTDLAPQTESGPHTQGISRTRLLS